MATRAAAASTKTLFDVIVIGGSYAGLSASLSLGRSMRKTLVVDSGLPCNRWTPASHNFLTHDGRKPSEIAAIAKDQVLKYNEFVSFVSETATGIKKVQQQHKEEEGTTGVSSLLFEVDTKEGNQFQSRKIVYTAGIKDLLMVESDGDASSGEQQQKERIPGLAACWGKSVIHCPYCHGFEFRLKKTGILVANEMMLSHFTPVVANLSGNGAAAARQTEEGGSSLTLFTNGVFSISEEWKTRLEKYNVSICEGKILRLEHSSEGMISGLVVTPAGGAEKDAVGAETIIPLSVLYAHLPFKQHLSFVEEDPKEGCDSSSTAGVNCAMTPQGYIQVDEFQKTTCPGFFAAGDCTTRLRSVANAVNSGGIAGAMCNAELSLENWGVSPHPPPAASVPSPATAATKN